jgi:tetratricopeptide (TPR) repeat protein
MALPLNTPGRFCPYKGLTHYSEEDAPYFFGRDAEREIISANLLAYRLTLIYGPSGVGKSSVLRAGVAHHLKAAALRNIRKHASAEHAITVFNNWGDNPIDSLLAAVSNDVQELTGRPAPVSGNNLADSLRNLANRSGGELLLILDQFEEYFLYHADEDGPGTFAWEFPRALASDVPVGFLVSIREDSLARLDRFKGRIPQLFDNYLRIDHLDERAARAAIVQPLREYNKCFGPVGDRVAVEHRLVLQVLEDVSAGTLQMGDSGRGTVHAGRSRARIETPYLQLIMSRLWEHERAAGSRVLRLKSLIDLGSAERIVRTHLDTALASLSEEERDIAAEIFRYLVTPSRTKIAHTVGDLAELASVDRPQLGALLEKLSSGAQRILCPVAPAPDQPTNLRYQIFHDVLAGGILDWRRRREEQSALAAASAREHEQHTRAEREARNARRFRVLTWGFAAAFVLMVLVAAYAIKQRNVARTAQKLAEQRDVEKLALAARVEEQQLKANAERAEKEGLASEAARLREEAAASGKRASAAEELSNTAARSTAAHVAAQSEEWRQRTELAMKDSAVLRKLSDALRAQLDATTAENTNVKKENADLKKKVDELTKKVDDLNDQLKRAADRREKERQAIAALKIPRTIAIGTESDGVSASSDTRLGQDAAAIGRVFEGRSKLPVEIIADERATLAQIRTTVNAMFDGAAPQEDTTLFLAGNARSRGDSLYYLNADADQQDLKLTAIPLEEIAGHAKSTRSQPLLIADLYRTGSLNDSALRSVLNRFHLVRGAALLVLHANDQDNSAIDTGVLIQALTNNAIPRRGGVANAVKMLRSRSARLKILQDSDVFVVYDVGEKREALSSLRSILKVGHPPDDPLAEGADKALDRLEAWKGSVPDEAYKVLSLRLLVALEDRANQVIGKALRALEHGVSVKDYAQCGSDLASALKIAPESDRMDLLSKAAFCLGSGLAMQRRYQEAETVLRRGAEDSPAAALLANAHGMVSAAQGDTAGALRWYVIASTITPEWVYPMRNMAVLLGVSGRLAEAYRAYAMAASLAPTNGTILRELAEVELSLADYTSAERHVLAALAVSQKDARNWLALGYVRQAMGRQQEAREMYERSLLVDPNLAEARDRLAILARQSRDYPRAEALWRDLLVKNREYLGGYLGLGEMYTEQGRYNEAANVYRTAVAINPGSTQLLKTAAAAMLRANQAFEAEQLARRSLNMQSADPEALELLGDAQVALGKSREALAAYTEALASSPSDRTRKSLTAKLDKLRSPR